MSDIEQLAISSGVEVDPLSTVCESILKEHGEEYPKEVLGHAFTPLLTGDASKVVPLKQTMLYMSSWKDVIMLYSPGDIQSFAEV